MPSGFNFFVTLKAAALALAAAMVLQCLFVLVHSAAGEPWRGDWGLGDVRDYPGLPSAVILGSVAPGGAAERAGLQAGDVVTFDHPTDLLRGIGVGDQSSVTVSRAGQSMRVLLQSQAGHTGAPSALATAGQLAHMVANLLTALLAAFALLRAGRSKALLALGMALTCMSDELSAIPGSRMVWGAWVDLLPALDRIFFGGGTALLVYFVVQFANETVGGLGRWPTRVMRAYGLTYFAVVAYRILLDFQGQSAWWPFDATFGVGGVLMAAFVFMGYRKSTGQTRGRYVMLILSFLLLLLAQLLMTLQPFSAIWNSPTATFIRKAAFDGFVFTFAYAVLRHRVVNLGFALNRSIVFAIVSAMLLVGFGIVEWLSEHLIHFEDRKKSVLLDGGIALGVYLLFHRVRHSVEHAIERLFFHHWHVNEDHLKRFVREAGYMVSAENLLHTFCTELARFSGGAASAIYILSDSGGELRRAMALGEMLHPASIDIDDFAVLALQTQRTRIPLEETRSALPYAEAFPFFHRGQLLGIVMLAAKPAGDAYRPDELEVLTWAAQQIGQDYQAVTLVHLQRSVEELTQRISHRDAELALLREVLRESSSAKAA